jgi:hypothetical protein
MRSELLPFSGLTHGNRPGPDETPGGTQVLQHLHGRESFLDLPGPDSLASLVSHRSADGPASLTSLHSVDGPASATSLGAGAATRSLPPRMRVLLEPCALDDSDRAESDRADSDRATPGRADSDRADSERADSERARSGRRGGGRRTMRTAALGVVAAIRIKARSGV